MALRWRTPVLTALGIIALCSLRLIHLEADTPPEISTESMAVYVDEGYKTLSPRNLLLFGSAQWNPYDQYPGWMKASPLTQWSYYLAFRLLGPRLGSARIVTILCFALFLVGYSYAMADDYHAVLFFLGLALLGILHTLFFFSRIALFELPIIACFYWLLFLLRRLNGLGAYRTVVLILIFSTFSALTIKFSSPAYYFPVLVGTLVTLGNRKTFKTIEKVGLSVGFVVIISLWITIVRGPLLARFDVLPTRIIREFFLHPLTDSTALLLVAGLACACHAMLTDPRPFFSNVYRSSLLATVIGGPALFGFFSYAPLRFYIPLLPAYLLFILEWFHLKAWTFSIPRRVSWPRLGICLLPLSSAMVCLLQAVNRDFLTASTLVSSAVVLSLAFLIFWRAALSGSLFLRSITVFLLLAALRDIYIVGNFLLSPSYRSREIAANLEQIVPEGRSIAGDLAPFFTLGTELKVLYATTALNSQPWRIRLLQPAYFLFSDTDGGCGVRRVIEDLDGIELGPPDYDSTYAGREIILYPLKYESQSLADQIWPGSS